MKIKSGIKLISESVGSGQSIKKGDQVTVRLNGWLSQGEPIQKDFIGQIVVGRRVVIPGIEQSLLGMKQGGIRTVTISPHLAYKAAGIKDHIPPNAVLTYTIEVLDIQPAAST